MGECEDCIIELICFKLIYLRRCTGLMDISNRLGTKQTKYNEPTTEGDCPYCHKHVQSLEAHIRSKHKGEKPPREEMSGS